MEYSYRADSFGAAINRISNYVGNNFDDGSNIRYVTIKLKKPVMDIPYDYGENTVTKTQIRIW